MEGFAVIFVILVVIAIVWNIYQYIVWNIYQYGEVSELRKTEQTKTDELNALKLEAADLRKAISDVQINGFVSTTKFSTVNTTSGDGVNCYFCWEEIKKESLVCVHCKNPNIKNWDEIMAHENKVLEIIS